MWLTIVRIIHLILSLIMIAVVLLQSGKAQGLSGAIAGNSQSYMNKSKMGGLDKKLAAATKWVALVWIVLTLCLSFFH